MGDGDRVGGNTDNLEPFDIAVVILDNKEQMMGRKREIEEYK